MYKVISIKTKKEYACNDLNDCLKKSDIFPVVVLSEVDKLLFWAGSEGELNKFNNDTTYCHDVVFQNHDLSRLTNFGGTVVNLGLSDFVSSEIKRASRNRAKVILVLDSYYSAIQELRVKLEKSESILDTLKAVSEAPANVCSDIQEVFLESIINDPQNVNEELLCQLEVPTDVSDADEVLTEAEFARIKGHHPYWKIVFDDGKELSVM